MSWIEKLGGEDTILRGVLTAFSWFCAVPHPSWGEAELSGRLAAELRAAGLETETDAVHNLRVELPATPGREDWPLLAAQGHLDMVCAVRPGSGWEPATHRVTPVMEGGFLRSNGDSSLGADNNLGNAALLWVLGQGVPHGPMRLIFTVAEEVGLEGAKRVDPRWLKGVRYLLNTDGFHLGRLIVSSAGGRRETFTRPLVTVPAPEGEAYTIRLSGFSGGHSGDNIHLGRCNAMQELAAFLRQAWLPVVDFTAGQGLNVIPAVAEATLLVPPGAGGALTEAVEVFRRNLSARFGRTDPDHTVELMAAEQPETVWADGFARDVLALVTGLHHGVCAHHADFPAVPSASANAALIRTADGRLEVGTFLRCTTAEQEEKLSGDNRGLAERCGFSASHVGYPGWAGDRSNPLARLMDDVFRKECGRAAEITAVHVGLELSVLQAKAPELVMVCTGPEILDAHSVDERAPLASVPPYAALLAGTLDRLGELD